MSAVAAAHLAAALADESVQALLAELEVNPSARFLSYDQRSDLFLVVQDRQRIFRRIAFTPAIEYVLDCVYDAGAWGVPPLLSLPFRYGPGCSEFCLPAHPEAADAVRAPEEVAVELIRIGKAPPLSAAQLAIDAHLRQCINEILRRKAHDLLLVAAAAPPLDAVATREEAGELMALAARLEAIGDVPDFSGLEPDLEEVGL